MREEAANAHVVDVPPAGAFTEEPGELVEVGGVRLDRMLRGVPLAQRAQELVDPLLNLAPLLTHDPDPHLLVPYPSRAFRREGGAVPSAAPADDVPCKPSSGDRAQGACTPASSKYRRVPGLSAQCEGPRRSRPCA